MDDLKRRFPIYGRLLKLYPAAYQKEYAEQMLQTLADMLDDAQTAGQRRVVRARAALELPFSITKQQLIVAGGIMTHETPNYIKRNSLVGALLLLPFFVALMADGLNKMIYHQDLYHSWLWSTPVLFAWVLLLPALAFGLSAFTFIRWSAERGRTGRVSSLGLLRDWRHNWPMLGVLIVSLGIVAMVFGHDSVHCVTGNPVRELQDWHKTWTCIEQR